MQRALELGKRPGGDALGGQVRRGHVLLRAEFPAAAAEPGDVVHLVGRRALGMTDHAVAERHEILAALDRVLEIGFVGLLGVGEGRDRERRLVFGLLHGVLDLGDRAQIGDDRILVARREKGIDRRGHVGRKLAAVAAFALLDRDLDLTVGPGAEAGLAVGRQIRAFHRVLRSLEGLRAAGEPLVELQIERAAGPARSMAIVAPADAVDEVGAALGQQLLGRRATHHRDGCHYTDCYEPQHVASLGSLAFFGCDRCAQPVAPVRHADRRILPKHDSIQCGRMRACGSPRRSLPQRRSGIPDLRMISREPACQQWVAPLRPQPREDQIVELQGTGISR